MNKHTRIHTQELPTPEEMDAHLDQRHTEPLTPAPSTFLKGCRIYTSPEDAQGERTHTKAQGELPE